ncbi:MAG TPA: ATP-dependent Clp protease adapter ClpS [Gammaproteobacteria bacterium]|nr:ATP-dependent Clp protease adapter ClpS [Gammaproteobacteria bacterium]
MNIELDTRTTESETAVEPQLKEPSLYQVIMHNDDFTPMEFVVRVLEHFFHMERVAATRTMVEVHTIGKAICGIFTKDVAETKVDQVIDYARMHDHPLLCSTVIEGT